MPFARTSAVLLLLCLALSAQTPLLRLNLSATDAQGQPVAGLTAADIRITDQGKARTPVYFRKLDAKTPVTGVVLLDLMNQNSVEGLEAFKKVGQSLSQLKSGEGLYLYILAMDGTLTPIHAIPQVPYAPGEDDKTWQKKAAPQLDKLAKSMIRARPSGLSTEDVAKKTYVALETVAKQLSSFNGRRNIIWVMKNVPTVHHPTDACNGDWLDCALYVQHLVFTLDRAGVAVHPVTYAAITDPNTNRGMDDFSGLLDGRPFFGDDLSKVIDRLRADAAAGYAVGIEVPATEMDSKYHRLKVTCERKGVKVDMRARYFALPDSRPPAQRSQEALRAALMSPVDDPQIGLKLQATPAAAGKAVNMKVQIDAGSLLLREQDGLLAGFFTMAMVGYSDKGPVGTPSPADFNLRLTREQHAAALKDGLPFAQDFPVDGSVKSVRFLIYDHGSGAVGTATAAVSK